MKSPCLGLVPVVVMGIHPWVPLVGCMEGHPREDTAVSDSEVAIAEDTGAEACGGTPRDAGVPTVAAVDHVKIWRRINGTEDGIVLLHWDCVWHDGFQETL